MGGTYADRRDSGRRVKKGKTTDVHRRPKGGSAVGMVKQSLAHELPKARYANHQQSEIVENFVAQELIGQGWSIAYPRTEKYPFDLIAVKGTTVLRIQAKSTKGRKTDARLQFCTNRYQAGGGKRRGLSCEDCDVLALVSVKDMSLFLVPVDDAISIATFTINSKNKSRYYRKFSNLKPCKTT